MQVKYRVLRGAVKVSDRLDTYRGVRADQDAHQKELESVVGTGRRYRSLAAPHIAAALASAAVSAPRTVTAEELSGTFEEVAALLDAGKVKASDLVDVGRGWQSFETCFEFDAICAELRAAARWRRRLWIGLAIAAVIAAALGIAYR